MYCFEISKKKLARILQNIERLSEIRKFECFLFFLFLLLYAHISLSELKLSHIVNLSVSVRSGMCLSSNNISLMLLQSIWLV